MVIFWWLGRINFLVNRSFSDKDFRNRIDFKSGLKHGNLRFGIFETFEKNKKKQQVTKAISNAAVGENLTFGYLRNSAN
jgi:hypothetical protein